ncbi:MAG: hypothetical protein ACHQ4H_04800 [Ktedonobacterales bacterium]
MTNVSFAPGATRLPGLVVKAHRVAFAGSISVLTLWLAGCGALVTSSPPIQATVSTHVSTPQVTPSTTSPYYQDALTEPSPPSGWSSDPVCSFTTLGLVVKPSGGQAYICLVPAAPVANLAVTVTVQQLSGLPSHAFGIALRHNAAKSYYFFGVDGRGHYTFAVVVNDIIHSVIPFTANAAIHAGAGASNLLQVVAVGQQITLFVNGSPVGEVKLSTFATGTVGLRGINDGSVRFSHLTLKKA